MSTIKTNNIQLGQSGTPSENFTASTGQDGTMKLARGNQGATTQDIITVDASGNVNANVGLMVGGVGVQRLVFGTPVNVSGTFVDFSNIPTWARRITVMMRGVSTSGSAIVIAQLGTSGGIQTTGYACGCSYINNSNITGAGSFTNGLAASFNNAAVDIRNGQLTLINMDGNNWIATGVIGLSNGISTGIGGGAVTIGGPLTTVRLTTTNGTDVFDAGTVNILIEG